MATIDSKTDAVEKQLRRELEEGKFSSGERFYSTREAAEKFAAAPATAYRALANLVQKGYLVSRNGLGIFVTSPNPGSKLQVIGVPLRLQSNPQVLDFYEKLSAAAEKRGIRLLMGNGEGCKNELSFLNKMADLKVDGVIRFPCGFSKPEHLVRTCLRQLRLKCVNFNDWWRPGEGFPTVKSDEVDALIKILDALYAAGHRKISLAQETFYGLRPDIQTAFWKWHWMKNLPLSADSLFCCLNRNISLPEDLKKMVASGVTAMIFSYGLNIQDIWDSNTENILKNMTLAALDNIPLAETELFAAYSHDNEKIAETALDLLQNYENAPAEPVKIPGKLILK